MLGCGPERSQAAIDPRRAVARNRDRIRIIQHDVVPRCGSFEVRFPQRQQFAVIRRACQGWPSSHRGDIIMLTEIAMKVALHSGQPKPRPQHSKRAKKYRVFK